MEVVRPLSTEQWRREQYPLVLRLYGSGQVYANPVVLELLDGVGRPTGHLLWDEREIGLVALHWVVKGTPGAVKVRRSGNGATWTMGPVLVYHPGLRVAVGEVRLLPVRVEAEKFLVELGDVGVVGSQKGRR
jgi:hypothetical protein